MLNGHGDDLHRYRGIKANFSSNILSGVDHTPLMSHLAQYPGMLSSYPEPDASSLARRLGPEGCVEVTAGATEAIYLLAMAHRGQTSAIISPTFREYEDACHLHGHAVRYLTHLSEVTDEDLVWLCNPNNPTGTVTPLPQLMSAVKSHPSTLFIIDQAYAPYTLKPVISDSDAIEAGNAVLLSSLTKRFSVPGLRIGYAVGASAIISRINAVRMPWSVNAIALEAAHWLLDHEEDYLIDASALNKEAEIIADNLRQAGIEVTHTDSNFILCRLPGRMSAAKLKEHLAISHAILIRDASNFHGLTPSHFRIAAQSPEQNLMLVKAIKDYVSHSDL
ncbi:MAG: aminotransferase class I/II-fold pyridoxal phosphate-dependent enzyme [Muribaculaceae bacterium]|nr:aminotransferase class I/II-fold pyridoxal phosphate-dependent enzyme [Muribaculaceae bacterium]